MQELTKKTQEVEKKYGKMKSRTSRISIDMDEWSLKLDEHKVQQELVERQKLQSELSSSLAYLKQPLNETIIALSASKELDHRPEQNFLRDLQREMELSQQRLVKLEHDQDHNLTKTS